jgi:hypothetical protein
VILPKSAGGQDGAVAPDPTTVVTSNATPGARGDHPSVDRRRDAVWPAAGRECSGMTTVNGGLRLAAPQKVALGVGVLNLAAAALHVLPLSPVQHWAQLATGAAGLLLARSPGRARLFGMLLVAGYGAMLAWDLSAGTSFGAWLPVRMIASGIAIEVAAVRTGGRSAGAPSGSRPGRRRTRSDPRPGPPPR